MLVIGNFNAVIAKSDAKFAFHETTNRNASQVFKQSLGLACH